MSDLEQTLKERLAARELERVADELEQRAEELGLPVLAEAVQDLRCRAVDLRERPGLLVVSALGVREDQPEGN